MEVLRRFTSKLEPISIDEAFLDVSDYSEDGIKLANLIQKSIFENTSLPCSLGIAANKLVAKIATDFGKTRINTNTYPNAIQAVPFGKEAEFLAPLPTEILWGVGPKTANELNNLGITTIGALAKWPKEDLISRFGQYGYVLSLRANGIDNREVTTNRSAKSFSQEVTFSKNINDKDKLKRQVEKQCKSISKRLKNSNLLGSVVKIKLRWPDFTTITRQTTLPKPTADDNEIFKAAFELFINNWNKNHPVRLLGVGISGLHPPDRQLSLWDKTNYKKIARIEKALQAVRQKFGEDALSKGIIKDRRGG
jgi:DNA polymerase-4